MSDLDEKLEELLESEDAGLENEGIESYDYPELVVKIKQAFIDAGWIDTTQLGGIRSTTICRPEGNIEFMTGQEWLDKTLRAVAAHLTNDGWDYIRSNKDFRARTITVGELEAVLKKAAGIE